MKTIRIVTPYILLITLCYFSPRFAGADTPDPNCKSENHRQFDFWIGEWYVYDNSNGKLVGTSKVELILGDCVLLESWTGTDGFLGKSFNLYESASGRWKQRWVDSRGQLLEFEGSYDRNAMRLAGIFRKADGTGAVHARMTFHNLRDGKVRQVWEQSGDSGKTFKTFFDGTYQKSKR